MYKGYKKVFLNNENLLMNKNGNLFIVAAHARENMPIALFCSRGNINDYQFSKSEKFIASILLSIIIIFCSYFSYKFFSWLFY